MILTQYEVVSQGITVARHEDYLWCVNRALDILKTFPEAPVIIKGGPRFRPEGERLCAM